MNRLPYKQHLLKGILNLEVACYNLEALSLNFIFFDDLRDYALPFEEDDVIPVDLALLKVSDIPSVKTILKVVVQLRELILFLKNTNNLSTDDMDDRRTSLKHQENLRRGFSVDLRISIDKLINEAVIRLSYLAFDVLSACYTMQYGSRATKTYARNFYAPDDECYIKLASEDVNICKLLVFANFLLSERDELVNISSK